MTAQRCAQACARSAVARRAAYSLAAGAAAAGGQSAEATIIYSGIEDISIKQGFYQSLKFDADQYIDVYLRNYKYPANNYQGIKVEFANGRFVGKRVNNLNYAKALAPGYVIDASKVNFVVGSLANGPSNPNAEFTNVQNAYIGLGFPISGDGSPDNYFGWIRVSIDNAAGTFIVHEWAYENTLGTAIKAGDRGAAGDFNDDGRVDAADYTVWRDNLGTDFNLSEHGDEVGASLGVVDIEDYNLWKVAFGWVAPDLVPGAGAAVSLPEPATLGFLAAGALGLLALRRRRKGGR
jgi:hypothetical protein